MVRFWMNLEGETTGIVRYWKWDKEKKEEVKADSSFWPEWLEGLLCHLLRLGRQRPE